MNIINFIPFGRENAISRSELHALTGLVDRKNRSLIKEYNKQQKSVPGAIVVLSSSSVRGYWRTNDISEMEHYLAESHHRRRIQTENDEPIEEIVAAAKGNSNCRLIRVRSYDRRKNVRENEKPQIEGQIRL